MSKTIAVALVAALVLITPAVADWSGQYEYYDSSLPCLLWRLRPILFVGSIAVLALLFFKFIEWCWRSGQTTALSAAADYDDRAEKTRALKRKLDADTALAESYIQAMRARGQLDELGEMIVHDRLKQLSNRRR